MSHIRSEAVLQLVTPDYGRGTTISANYYWVCDLDNGVLRMRREAKAKIHRSCDVTKSLTNKFK